MGIVYIVVGALFGIVMAGCWIILLIAAFKDDVWKGLVGLFCFIYLVYYGLVEFEHPRRVLITLGFLVTSILARMFLGFGRFH
jgi:hypothetical protein